MEYAITSNIKVLDEDNRSYSENDIIQSVGTEGILVPLLVYKEGPADYVLIAGHRRLASAKHFGLGFVPVTVLEKSQETVARALENIDRKNLHPLDEADQIRKLQDQGWTNNQIAATLGVGLDKVRRRAKLNNLSKKYLKQFREGKISAEQAEELAVFPAEVQDKVDAKKWMNAKELRSVLVASNGISLSECTDDFLKMDPCCADCPENTITGENELFPGLNGSCKNPQCYAKKLKKLMEDIGAKGIVAPREEIKDLVPVAAGDFWRFTSSVVEGSDKYLSQTGRVMYYYNFSNDKKTPKQEKQTEIENKYKEEHDRFEKNKPAFFKECAKAFMEKNYRGIPMTSKSDLVLMAQKIIEEDSWNIGRLTGLEEKDLTVMDNQGKVGLVMMIIHSESEDMLYDPAPGVLRSKCDKVTAPEWLYLPDKLTLRKIKAQSKLLDSISKLQQILTEYNGVLDGNDE